MRVFNDSSVNRLMSMLFYFVSNTCMSWFDYYSIPCLNGNLASAEKMFWTLEIPFKTGVIVFVKF
jgi:hypothetical protein